MGRLTLLEYLGKQQLLDRHHSMKKIPDGTVPMLGEILNK